MKRSVSRRQFTATVAGGFALVATGSRAWAQRAQLFPLTVNTTTPTDVLPFFYAHSKGMFRDAGIDVSIQLAGSGSTSLIAVIGNAVPIGFTNTLTLTNARDKGVMLEALAPGGEYDTNDPNALMLVNPGSPIRRAQDLRGKTMAVTGLHDLLSVAVDGWLDQRNVDAKTIKFVEIPGPTMIPALKQHRVDVIAIYDPYAHEALREGMVSIGKPFDGIAPRFLTAVWFGKKSWLDAHRGVADRFASVIRNAAAYTNEHYDELIPFVASFSKQKPETLETIAHIKVPSSVDPSQVQPVIAAAVKYEKLRPLVATDEIFKVTFTTT